MSVLLLTDFVDGSATRVFLQSLLEVAVDDHSGDGVDFWMMQGLFLVDFLAREDVFSVFSGLMVLVQF